MRGCASPIKIYFVLSLEMATIISKINNTTIIISKILIFDFCFFFKAIIFVG
jgi:hypothetical protein